MEIYAVEKCLLSLVDAVNTVYQKHAKYYYLGLFRPT